jgi:hypothetical protein
MYGVFRPGPRRFAAVVAVAIMVSGCDGLGTGVGERGVVQTQDSEATFRKPGDGVELSKYAVDELADFVAAVQFGAVLPMSLRLQNMPSAARQRFFSRLEAARSELRDAIALVEESDGNPTVQSVRALQKANQKVENILRAVSTATERAGIRKKGEALLERHPFLRGLSRKQIGDILLRAWASSQKVGKGASVQSLQAAVGDTSSGDTCRTECGITATIRFGAAELAFLGATLGCTVSSLAIVPCISIALGMKFYHLGALTWGLYTCVKKCN